MDFLKSCGSGILTLNGWSTFTYESYGISQGDTKYHPTDTLSQNDPTILDCLLAVESALVGEKYIIHVNTEKCVIWIFGPTAGEGDFTSGSPNLDSLCENKQISVHHLSKGIFKSSDLASQSTLRRINSAPGNAPLAQEVKNILSTSKSPHRQDTTLPIEIYSRFLAGLARTLSFRLAKDSLYLPLSTNEFVHARPKSSLDSQRKTVVPLKIVRTSLYLTTAGVLVLSIFPSKSEDVLPLKDLIALSIDHISGIPLVLSPIYCVVKHAGQCADEFDDIVVSQWRDMVATWLKQRAIRLPNLDKKESWVRVRNEQRLSVEADGNGSGNPLTFIWPVGLCFAPASLSAFSMSDSALSKNFTPLMDNHENSSTANGYSDPLDLAEKWAKDSQARERLLAARRLKKKEQAMTPKSASIPSPIASRPVAYGETHGVNGVYPTPPDGLSSQQAALPGAMEHSSTLVGSTDYKDAMEVDNEPHLAIEDAVDDLFEDMDEDDFAGNDITDADFSFFDQADRPDNIRADVVMKDEAEDQSITPVLRDIPQLKPEAVQDGEQTQDLKTSDLLGKRSKMTTSKQKTSPSDSVSSSALAKNGVRSLDPNIVLKSLFIPDIIEPVQEEKRHSAFAPVSFNNGLNGAYERYDRSGPFAFKSVVNGGPPRNKPDQISISLPKYAQNHRQKGSQLSSQSGAEMDDGDSDSELDNGIDVGSTPGNLQLEPFDGGDVNAQDSVVTQQISPFTVQPDPVLLLRKLFLSDGLFRASTSEAMMQTTTQLELDSISLLSKRIIHTHIKFDQNFVLAAQIVTEQVVFNTFGLASGFELSWPKSGEISNSLDPSLVSPFVMSSKRLFGGKISCNLLKYTSIQDTPTDQSQVQKQTGRPMQPKGPTNPRAENSTSGNPTRFTTPHLRLRRNDSIWDMLPPAVAFWDILGLGPTNGPKNISTYTIFPASKSLESVVDCFINDLGQCYESSKLGIHHVGTSQDSYVPWEIKVDDPWLDIESSFQNLCTRLGSRLAIADHENKTSSKPQGKRSGSNIDCFVVYVVCPFTSSASLAAIAYGFACLVEAYRRVKTQNRNQRADVVLQILPLSLVAKDGEFITPESQVLQALAREVYNRCPLPVTPDDAASLPILSGSSIQLAEALPRKIAFELTSEVPLNIMHDPSHFHLGYARSASGNWITAAYSDNAGKYQAVTSYCLTGSRSFLDVAKEIWQTCIEIMRVRKVNWRLCIARAHYMPSEELEAWTSLSAPQQPFPLITLVTSVELDPPLSILPVLNLPSTPAQVNTGKLIQTPIGTPAPQPGVSPDPAGTPAATPSENIVADAMNDPDAHLVDTTDETWSIILAHRLHLLPTPYTDFHQVLSSALIIRIPPTTPTPNPFSPSETLDPGTVNFIGVHLLSARNSAKSPDAVSAAPGVPAVPKPQSDNILREFLTPLRNLALLAKVRGLSDGKAGLVPWHVLMAVRGVEGLDRVYGFERWAPQP